MGKFFTHKKNAQDLNDSIQERRKVSNKIDSFNEYVKGASLGTCYFDSNMANVLFALENGDYSKLYPITNYPITFCSANYTLECPKINYQLEEYTRLYEKTGDYRYFILIRDLLSKQLSKLTRQIRYLYKKLTTNYRIDLFNLIRNIIRKLLKSLDDDTDSSVIKSYNFFLNQKLSFYKILITVNNEKETKEGIYRRLK